MGFSRQRRRLSVTLAPNLYSSFQAISEYYNLKHDPSAVVNLCVHTVAKALGEKLSNESKQEPANVASEASADSGKPA